MDWLSLHPPPNRSKNLLSRHPFRKSPMELCIRLLAVGVFHCSLPTGTGIPCRSHSTTATSGALCCHRRSFLRSLATSSRCSRCRRGHCACRRAEHLVTHSVVSIVGSPIFNNCLFVQHMQVGGKRKSNDCLRCLQCPITEPTELPHRQLPIEVSRIPTAKPNGWVKVMCRNVQGKRPVRGLRQAQL